MDLILLNSVRLQQLAIHPIKVDQEVFVKGESHLAKAHLIDHHERDLVLFVFLAVVDHIHVHDVVVHHDVLAKILIILALLVTVLAAPNLTASISIAQPFHALLVLATQSEHNIKDSGANIEVSQHANHVFELRLFTHLQSFVLCRESLELLKQEANNFQR